LENVPELIERKNQIMLLEVMKEIVPQNPFIKVFFVGKGELTAYYTEKINEFNLQDRITIINGDALYTSIKGKYDLIFIDAAKGQYTKFFEKYKYFLKPNGVIISDNLKFHGHVGNRNNIANRNLKQLVGKIENYIDFLKDNEEFETKFYDVGDGLSVSIKKNDI
jgi:predicted O-methyltransferase YrrM